MRRNGEIATKAYILRLKLIKMTERINKSREIKRDSGDSSDSSNESEGRMNPEEAAEKRAGKSKIKRI